MATARETDVLVLAARTCRARFDELITEIVGMCIDEVPTLGEPDLRAALVASCAENVSNMLDLLEADAEIDPDDVPDGAIALTRDLVHLGAEASAIQRAYRLGHSWFQKRVIAAAAEEVTDAAELHEVTVRISDWCFSWFDTMRDVLASEHAAEVARWQPSGAALRAAALASVLDGSCDDIDAASLTLGYDLRGPHVAAIVWHDAPPDSINLRMAAAAMLGGATPARPLVHEASSSAAWVWWPLQTAPAVAGSVEGVHLVIGEARAGISGFRRSHEEAGIARRVALRRATRAPSVTRFREVELIALLTADRDGCDAFLRETLGPLADPDPGAQRLRATLLAVYEESSMTAAAARLGVHHNTVVYRVRKAEELLGTDIHALRLRLQNALHVAEGLELFR